MKQDVFPVGQGARKRRSQWLAFGIFKLLSYSIVLILFAILGFIIYKGIGVISWEFLTTAPSDGMTGGGIWPANEGTLYPKHYRYMTSCEVRSHLFCPHLF